MQSRDELLEQLRLHTDSEVCDMLHTARTEISRLREALKDIGKAVDLYGAGHLAIAIRDEVIAALEAK